MVMLLILRSLSHSAGVKVQRPRPTLTSVDHFTLKPYLLSHDKTAVGLPLHSVEFSTRLHLQRALWNASK